MGDYLAVFHRGLEHDEDARDHLRRLALKYSRLIDLTAMREGLKQNLAVNFRSTNAVSAITDLEQLEVRRHGEFAPSGRV